MQSRSRTSGARVELDLLENGRETVLLGNVQLARHHGWPGADEKLHIAVLAPGASPSRETAQRQVDEARARIGGVMEGDDRLRSIIERHGVVWEYAGDDGSADLFDVS